MRVASIIINRPAKQLHKPLSYLLPEKFGDVKAGTRVLVPLGGSREEGIVIGYEELLEKPTFTLRSIIDILDSDPWFYSGNDGYGTEKLVDIFCVPLEMLYVFYCA